MVIIGFIGVDLLAELIVAVWDSGSNALRWYGTIQDPFITRRLVKCLKMRL